MINDETRKEQVSDTMRDFEQQYRKYNCYTCPFLGSEFLSIKQRCEGKEQIAEDRCFWHILYEVHKG